MFAKIMAAALVVVSAAASATPGGVDANGCHRSKTVGYHCHAVKIQNIVPYIPGETQAAHSERLGAQCVDKPNEGVCFGYARRAK
jgi:hypothetical protein